MSNRLFFSLAALAAILMVALALNWPEGEASRGPAPAATPEAAPDPAPRTD